MISFKKYLIGFWLLAILSTIAYLFWDNEWKYSLPTPVPTNYHNVKTGDIVNLNSKIEKTNGRPVFLHFFNPGCPCSRFNIPQFVSLVRHYKDKLDFTIVVMNDENKYTKEDIQDKFGIDIPIIFDKAIADSCGVYSTPQAVIIDSDNKLYYRGNYNKSRYCTLKSSNYAQMAIDSFLVRCEKPVFSESATKSYGCQLPNCKKTDL